MRIDEVATARAKKALAELNEKIANAERANAELQALPDRTPEAERQIAVGIAAIQAAKERAVVLARFAEGSCTVDVVGSDDT